MKGERSRWGADRGPFHRPGRAPRAAANTNAGGTEPAGPPVAARPRPRRPGLAPLPVSALLTRPNRPTAAGIPGPRAGRVPEEAGPGRRRACWPEPHLRARSPQVGRGDSRPALWSTPRPAAPRWGRPSGSRAAHLHPSPQRILGAQRTPGSRLREARLDHPCARLPRLVHGASLRPMLGPSRLCAPPAAPHPVSLPGVQPNGLRVQDRYSRECWESCSP
ncbi:translation initiation factor IF-2-like [Cervus canadensis]|uniref:translation initiation factor IF-2-like n=1 Tax=Cervus canadensis TaxID=1574408 RepID=UPI001CA32EE1|nr:translation initiation factor IF-2-like [Cervus canadensis]